MNVYELDCGPQMLILYVSPEEWGSAAAPLELCDGFPLVSCLYITLLGSASPEIPTYMM